MEEIIKVWRRIDTVNERAQGERECCGFDDLTPQFTDRWDREYWFTRELCETMLEILEGEF